MPLKAKPCKLCDSPWHTAMNCPTKPRATLNTYQPMNKIGKVQKATQSAVEKWKATQQPNHQGYYVCYIGGDYITYKRAEHPYSKARHPELRTDQVFELVCDPHNELKGSLDIHDFLEKYPEFKKTVKRIYLNDQN